MKQVGLIVALFATSAQAEEANFVESNILSIFYHELGHAVIDIESVPIFAQEEDAADVFSILLIDAFWDEGAAEAMAYQAASGFWAEALWRDGEGETIAWWDSHSPDERRFYNTVCIFYGANPEARADFARDLDLPEDRASYCPEEYDLAADSWGGVIDVMLDRGAGDSFRMKSADDSLTAQLVLAEVDALNDEMSLDQPLEIVVERCGEANAFYDPSAVQVIMCLEFEDHLRELERLLDN